jgi:serine/threonine-protein kinase
MGTESEEESRQYLQERLRLSSKILFWTFAALLAFALGTYELFPRVRPAKSELVYGGGEIGLVLIAGVWLLLRRHRRVSIELLYAIDLLYVVSTGLAFAASALFSPDLPPARYVALFGQTLVLFTRALVVPSTGLRTALVSAVSFVPLTASAIAIAASEALDVPGSAFVLGDVVLSMMVVLVAATGSQIIYGLRRKFSAAMQLGAYTLGDKIGAGGMGTVYRAQHALLRRPAAIKVLPPDRVGKEQIARFELEVRHMSELTHANTVAIFDFGHTPDGLFYYVMEYLDGIDLEKLVRRYGPQPPARVIRVLAQVCRALQEAHDHGIVHRDIKPANIILCERGGDPDVAKVVDYGLVKEIDGDVGVSQQVVLGTPDYIAPEAVTGDPIGPRSDLYAVGAVGYYLLTAKRVFSGKTSLDVCIQHVTQEPVPPSHASEIAVPAELEALVMRCLAKKPDDRPASASALADSLAVLQLSHAWSADTAREWWRDHRTNAADALSRQDASTTTLAIDLARRT